MITPRYGFPSRVYLKVTDFESLIQWELNNRGHKQCLCQLFFNLLLCLIPLTLTNNCTVGLLHTFAKQDKNTALGSE